MHSLTKDTKTRSYPNLPFSEYLTSVARDVEMELSKTLEEWQESLTASYPFLSPFTSAFIEQCQGGKRIRGALVAVGYSLSGGDRPRAILPACVAFEIFQTAILAHDDVIDKSELRRGKPSLYVALGGNHYGMSQTISIGDLGFFLASDILAKSSFPPERVNKAMQFFFSVLQNTAAGEILDVYSPTRTSFTEEDILSIIKLKTSPYTLIGPLSVGAILAGGNKKLLRTIELFGQNLGIAYQIHDDILGVFAEEETLGKSNSSDITEGKSTHLYLYAKQHADGKQKKLLEELYGNAGISKYDVKTVQGIFKDTGAYTYASELVKDYTKKACDLIPELTSDAKHQALLLDITRFLMERKK